jgi:hypothetical protein
MEVHAGHETLGRASAEVERAPTLLNPTSPTIVCRVKRPLPYSIPPLLPSYVVLSHLQSNHLPRFPKQYARNFSPYRREIPPVARAWLFECNDGVYGNLTDAKPCKSVRIELFY